MEVLAVFTSNHSPLIFTLNINQDEVRGKDLWKVNNLLVLNSIFFDKMKAHIANIQKNLGKENIREDQARLEYLKNQIRRFWMKFSKVLSKNTKTQL